MIVQSHVAAISWALVVTGPTPAGHFLHDAFGVVCDTRCLSGTITQDDTIALTNSEAIDNWISGGKRGKGKNGATLGPKSQS